MQAKDQQIQELRAAVQQRDNSLQKFIKLNGSLVQNPKEEPYSKVILQNYERAQVLQEEKIGLSEKAAALVSALCTALEILLMSIKVGPPCQATRHQIARPAERWVNTI
jgi:inhibitor of growth protein 3